MWLSKRARLLNCEVLMRVQLRILEWDLSEFAIFQNFPFFSGVLTRLVRKPSKTSVNALSRPTTSCPNFFYAPKALIPTERHWFSSRSALFILEYLFSRCWFDILERKGSIQSPGRIIKAMDMSFLSGTYWLILLIMARTPCSAFTNGSRSFFARTFEFTWWVLINGISI